MGQRKRMKAPIALALGAMVNGGQAIPGDLRIKGGDVANRMFHGSVFGRLEIFGGDAMTWGTICDQGFSMEDATVACQQLGYRHAGWFSNYFKISNGNWASKLQVETGSKLKIHYSQVECTGDESEFGACRMLEPECECTHDRDVIMFCKKRCPINPQTEMSDCSIPDPPPAKPKDVCDDMPESCKNQIATMAEPCNTCRQWKAQCYVEPEVVTTPAPTTTTPTTTQPPTTTAKKATPPPKSDDQIFVKKCDIDEGGKEVCKIVSLADLDPSERDEYDPVKGSYFGRADDSSFDFTERPEGLLGDDATQIDKLDENGEVVPVNEPMGTMDEDQNGSGLVSQKDYEVDDAELLDKLRNEGFDSKMEMNEKDEIEGKESDMNQDTEAVSNPDESNWSPTANKFDGVDVEDEQATEETQFPDEDEYGNTYQQTLDDDTTDTSSANLPAEVSKVVPISSTTTATTTTTTTTPMRKTSPKMTSTKAPIDEPEFGAASILEDNENEDKKGEVIEEDDIHKEQLGTFPLWVWILVAIIGVVVILCIVLVITRCVRRNNGRTIYKDPLQTKIDF